MPLPLERGLDVTDYGQAQAVVQHAVQHFGRVDILVNCAGAWRVNLFVDSQPEAHGSPIFKVVQKKWYLVLCQF